MVIVAGAALGTGEPAGDPLDQHSVVHAELDHRVDPAVEVLQHRVERLRLGQGARKSVENKAVRAVRLEDALGQHGDDDLVGDETALFHDLAGAKADFATRRDF